MVVERKVCVERKEMKNKMKNTKKNDRLLLNFKPIKFKTRSCYKSMNLAKLSTHSTSISHPINPIKH